MGELFEIEPHLFEVTIRQDGTVICDGENIGIGSSSSLETIVDDPRRLWIGTDLSDYGNDSKTSIDVCYPFRNEWTWNGYVDSCTYDGTLCCDFDQSEEKETYVGVFVKPAIVSAKHVYLH